MGTGADGFVRRAARVALIYLAFGVAWILLSDKVVALWAADLASAGWWQSLKGLAYILITATLVFFATRHVLIEQYHLIRRADRNEHRFVTTFELAGVGISMLSPEGRWLRANPRLCQTLGYTEEELQALTYLEITHPDDQARSRAHFDDAAFGTQSPQTLEKRYMRKDGSVVWVMATLAPAIDRGKDSADMEYLIAVEEDISDRKRIEHERDLLEAEFLQAQKMEAVGRLAGGVAHDFNNMLSVITGYTETAMEELGTTHPVHDDLEQVRLAAERSAALTRQLLAFARKEIVAPKTIDLNQVIEESAKIFRRMLGSEIELTLNLAPGLWPLYMDPSQVDQVLMNLAINSRDAIRGPGHVWLETRCVTAGKAGGDQGQSLQPGDYVCLSFRDDGCGMSPETQARAFEPFYTTKPVGQGTGLGLATVYGIVRQNHGFVELSSTEGQGTTFHIYFPRNESRKADIQRSATPILGGSETILLVEDEPQILDLCRRVLFTRGYQVLAFDDPRRALEAVAQHTGPIHLLVTDFVMPGMDGAALASALKRQRPIMRVICLSGHHTNDPQRVECLPEGTRFLQKPISPAVLLQEIRDILQAPQGGIPRA